MTKAAVQIDDQVRMANGRFIIRSSGLVILMAVAVSCVGCTVTDGPTTKPSTVSERQDSALHDPFGYTTDKDPANISGGEINQYDRNAMKKDLDHVLNP